jgi:dTMP kinase
MENKTGKLITFSGIDGSGKSTLCEMVFQHYQNQIPSALLSGFEERIFTNELEHIAEKMKRKKYDVFSDYICNIAWLCDFAYTVIDLIVPLLNSGTTVFVDRYYLCAKVYSMATTKQHIDKLFALYACLPKPDICIYLSVNPKEAMQRIVRREKKRVYYETEKYLTKIKKTYEAFIPKENYHIESINASCSLNESFAEIIKSVDQVIVGD